MRNAQHSDMDYFVRAGREYCEYTPFSFNQESYVEVLNNVIDDPDCIFIVSGDPVNCHSLAKLTPNFYNASEIIAKVFSTWGLGGLKCFREVERIAKQRGAKFLLADSMIEPRIIRFYEKTGMVLQDSVFIKEL